MSDAAIHQEITHAHGLLAAGKPAEAEAACLDLVRRYPRAAYGYVLLGHLQRLRGAYALARESLEKARKLDASIPQAHAELGLVLAESGDAARGAPFIQRSLELAPNDANMHWIAGQAAAHAGKVDAAEKAFAQAERLAPGIGEHRYRLGLAALEAGKPGVAFLHFSAMTRRRPDMAGAWTNLGLALFKMENVEESIAAFDRARKLRPNDAMIAAFYADAMLRAGADLDGTVEAYRTAYALDSASEAVAVGYASALSQTVRYEEAKRVAHGVLERNPEHLLMRWLSFQQPLRMSFDNLAERDAHLDQWRGGMARFMLSLEKPGTAEAWAETVLDSISSYYLTYRGEPLVEEHRANAQALRRLVEANGLATGERAAVPITRMRRRIGIVSPHLYTHSVHKVFGPMTLALPRDAFELVVFHPSRQSDAVTDQWRERADAFHDGDLRLAEWVERIVAADLDVLVYLDIGMHPVTNALTALRLAPVQVALWGHPVTTGSASVDHFVSAQAIEPPDAASHYVENLVLLPNLGTNFATPDVTASPFRDRETVELACVQNAAKIQPQHDECWARILAQAPNARLSVYCGAPPHVADGLRTRLARALEAAGVDPARLTVREQVSPAEFDAALGGVDGLLDTFDFSGGITGFECLARDLPIVALPGICMRGRQTAAMLRHVGVDELVARDADDYVALAVRLASDAAWRRALVAKIAAGKSRLFDDITVNAAFATFLAGVQPR